jgi:predicted NUDIX family NTP pyrophosphohydrolase
MEWPRHSGRLCEFPEVDAARWFDLDEARTRISKGQADFLERLALQLEGAD